MGSIQRELSVVSHGPAPFARPRQIPKSFPVDRWKENLRMSCLENARKRRRDLVVRKRGQLSLADEHCSEISAKNVVAEQCWKHGVGLVSLTPEDPQFSIERGFKVSLERSEPTDQENCMDVDQKSKIIGAGRNPLTEDDLFEILREVEEELRADDETFLEEVLEAEDNYLQNEINDYEKWEDAMEPDSCVACPLCKTSFLTFATEKGIVCSDDFCPLRIGSRDAEHEEPLTSLKCKLEMLHESHASYCCDALEFTVSSCKNGVVLQARCQSCNIVHRFE
eukprot:scaffold721_cov131-Cylindrotheca_fusiformis.AAC.27